MCARVGGRGGQSLQSLRLTDSLYNLLRRLVLGEHAHCSHVDQAGCALGRESERAEHASEQVAVHLVRVKFEALVRVWAWAHSRARAWKQDWVRGAGGEGVAPIQQQSRLSRGTPSRQRVCRPSR